MVQTRYEKMVANSDAAAKRSLLKAQIKAILDSRNTPAKTKKKCVRNRPIEYADRSKGPKEWIVREMKKRQILEWLLSDE